MTCAGKTLCNMYRDKKYCRTVGQKMNDDGVCDCRHAVRPCDVEAEQCFIENVCLERNSRRNEDHEERSQ